MSKSELNADRQQSIWPAAIIVLGLSLTAAWVGILGFGLIWLIG